MTILVSGTSGQLGRLILDALIQRGVPTSDLVAGTRSPNKIKDLRTRGIRTVAFDYDNPDTLPPALEGVDRVVLVSVSQPNTPTTQHDAVVGAIAAAGIDAVAYTSVARAATSALPLAPIHAATERAIADAGVPAVILRNNSYAELYFGAVAQASRSGFITSAAGDGRIAAATRPDFAAAAAVAIMEDRYLGRVLELAGDTAFSHADLAAIATRMLGRPISHRSLTAGELRTELVGAGLVPRMVDVLSQIDAAVAAGDLDSSDHTLSEMIGRPTTSFEEALRAAR